MATGDLNKAIERRYAWSIVCIVVGAVVMVGPLVTLLLIVPLAIAIGLGVMGSGVIALRQISAARKVLLIAPPKQVQAVAWKQGPRRMCAVFERDDPDPCAVLHFRGGKIRPGLEAATLYRSPISTMVVVANEAGDLKALGQPLSARQAAHAWVAYRKTHPSAQPVLG